MSDKDRRYAERQKELEAIAKKLLVNEGLQGLTIDGVAKLSKYSRPTVHQHFGGAAGLLDVVAMRMLEQAKALSVSASMVSENSPRERALACVLAYEILARFHPDDFNILEYLGYPWVLRKLPDNLREQHRSAVTGFSNQLATHIQAAVDDGSLPLAPGVTVASLTFHSIALAYGSYSSIIKNRVFFQISEQDDAWVRTRSALDAFWDGNGWTPNSTEVDYTERALQIFKKAYPPYYYRMKKDELRREIYGDGTNEENVARDDDADPPALDDDGDAKG